MLPRAYVWLVTLSGASIGAVAGLSKSPVGSTVLELVAVFVAGAGSAYLFTDTKLVRSTAFLQAIGKVGIYFLAAFWGALLLSSSYRYYGPDVFQHFAWWSKRYEPMSMEQIESQLKHTELQAHLAAIGTVKKDRETILQSIKANDDGRAKKSHTLCAGYLSSDKALFNIYLDNVTKIYADLRTCQQIDESARQASSYLVELSTKYRGLLSDIRSSGKDDMRQLYTIQTNFILAFQGLARLHNEIGAPPPQCPSNPEAVNVLKGKLINCEFSSIDTVTLLARQHGAAFASLWNATSAEFVSPAPGEEVQLPGIIERFE